MSGNPIAIIPCEGSHVSHPGRRSRVGLRPERWAQRFIREPWHSIRGLQLSPLLLATRVKWLHPLRIGFSRPSQRGVSLFQLIPYVGILTLRSGHFRGLCVIISKFVAEAPVTITLLVPNWFTTYEKAVAEIARGLDGIKSQKGVLWL